MSKRSTIGVVPLLYADEEFLTLLRVEAVHTLPRPLAEQLELAEA
jgi:hypothetical protein